MSSRAITETVTTDASGAATAYIPGANDARLSGKIINVIYNKTDYDDGVDFTITTETTAQGVWTESDVNASKTVAPRQPTHDNVGAASLYAAAGEAVEDYIHLCAERLKIVIAQGGNAKSGSFTLILAD